MDRNKRGESYGTWVVRVTKKAPLNSTLDVPAYFLRMEGDCKCERQGEDPQFRIGRRSGNQAFLHLNGCGKAITLESAPDSQQAPVAPKRRIRREDGRRTSLADVGGWAC